MKKKDEEYLRICGGIKMPEIKPINKEVRLKSILSSMEELKEDFAVLTDEYDADYADEQTMNLLAEASSAIDDAIDCMNDVMDLAE